MGNAYYIGRVYNKYHYYNSNPIEDEYTEIEVAANSRSEGYSLDGLPVSYYQVRENKFGEWTLSQIDGFDSLYAENTAYELKVKILKNSSQTDIPSRIYVFLNIVGITSEQK